MVRVRVGDEGFRIASVGLQAGNAEGKFIKIRASRFKKGVNPKFCVNSIWGVNRAKFI